MIRFLHQHIHELTKDSLHRNSFFLMVSTGIMSIVGFFFWMIASHLYTSEGIGLAGSLISLSTLLASISTFGLPPTLIHYLPTSQRKNEKVNTTLTLTAISAVIMSAIFWGVSFFLFREVHTLISTPWRFTFYATTLILAAWQQINDSIFIALKKTQWIIVESILYSCVKLVLAILLTSSLAFGIYSSNYIGMAVALGVSAIVHIKVSQLRFRPKLDISVLQEIGRYSLGSYVSSLIGMFPAQVLPILITSILGAESAAHFFLALMMMNLLVIVPLASSQTLFAAASADPKLLRSLTIKSIKVQVILISLGILGAWSLGGLVLSFFGSGYAHETTWVLRILSLAVIPMMFNYPLTTRLRVRKRMQKLTLVTLSGGIFVVMSSLIGTKFGLRGVAVGYVIGQLMTSFVFFIEWKIF